jgi:hypothetical protein
MKRAVPTGVATVLFILMMRIMLRADPDHTLTPDFSRPLFGRIYRKILGSLLLSMKGARQGK